MASVNINDEKKLIVSIKDISSLSTSVGDAQTFSTTADDINYIPGYVEAEKQRRENETERISNEAERKAYYQEIQEKVNNGEFKGEKGDKGEPGPKGDQGSVGPQGSKGEDGAPGTTDYNDLQNKPTIPTKTSDLVNDSDFIDSSSLSNKQDKLIAGTNITIENNVISSTGGGTSGTIDYAELTNKPKINGVILTGNKTLSELNIQEKGNYLENESDPIYTADKPSIALKTELFSKNYNDLSNKPTIPTKLSQLENDSSFLTNYTETDPIYSADKPKIALKTELFSKSYDDLTGKPTIPTKISDLTNDSDFVSDSTYVHTENNYTTAEKEKLENISVPTILYNSSDGAMSGIILTKSVSGYKKIKIYFKTGDNHFGSEEVFNNGKATFYTSVFKGSATGTNAVFYARVARILFDDKTVTVDRLGNLDIRTAANNTFTADNNAIKILRIEGLEIKTEVD